MVRIAGINLDNDKKIEFALPKIFGLGLSQVRKILKQTKIDPNLKTKTLNENQINQLREIIEKNYKVEGDLRREILLNIKRLKDINSYRGTRHNKNLPVRGQRTRVNSRTVRGNVRRTVSSGRKASAQKT